MAWLAVRGSFEAGIVPAFEASTGIWVEVVWTPTTVIMTKIAAGARADVLVVIADAMDRLVQQDS
jgi:molybdate transport system substrate-binding protein